MTEKQIELVKSSWMYVIAQSEEAGRLFYQRLFEVAPAVKPLFKSDPKEQERKLINMITLVVSKLNKLGDIMDGIKMLAQRHNKYGAQPAHYKVVGECLIWTLQQGLGDKWNKETEDAWLAAYRILSEAMIKNQAAAVAA